MAKIRKCTVCGHVEGEFVYFCTECGARTEESSDAIGNAEPIIVEKNNQPQNIAEYNNENVSDEESFFSSIDTKESDISGSKPLQKTNVKQLYAIGGGVIAILLVIIIVLALPKSKKGVEAETAVNDQIAKEEIIVDESEDLEEVSSIEEDVQRESETSTVILFDDTVGINCSDEKTLENGIASFEYTLNAGSMANTEPFRPTDNSISIVTESFLFNGEMEHINDLESFYVGLYEYSYGNLNQVGGYWGNCDKIEGGIEFNVEPSKQYVIEIVADPYANGEMLKGHGHVYGVKSVGDGDATEIAKSEVIFIEPTKMHYYEEMYYDQTYILDYNLEFEHDEFGRITKVTNYDSNHNIENTVTQQYDADGNCIREYSLGTNIEGLYLDYNDNTWVNGFLVQSRSEYSQGYYKYVYVNNSEGKPISCDFYENEDNFMHQDYTYDEYGRVSNIHRVNYWGDWTVDIVYHYDGDSEKPYMMECIYGDGSYSYDEYSYYYDENRLIQEIDRHYYNGELSSVITKEYEY